MVFPCLKREFIFLIYLTVEALFFFKMTSMSGSKHDYRNHRQSWHISKSSTGPSNTRNCSCDVLIFPCSGVWSDSLVVWCFPPLSVAKLAFSLLCWFLWLTDFNWAFEQKRLCVRHQQSYLVFYSKWVRSFLAIVHVKRRLRDSWMIWRQDTEVFTVVRCFWKWRGNQRKEEEV